MPGAEGRGQGGDGNYPATRDTKGSGNTSMREEMASEQDPAAPRIPQRGMVEGGRGEVKPHMHPNGASSARNKHGALSHRKYSLLEPEEPAGDSAATETQGSRDRP